MFLKEKRIRGAASLCTCCFGSLDFSCIQLTEDQKYLGKKCICTEQRQASTKQQANNHSHDIASVIFKLSEVISRMWEVVNIWNTRTWEIQFNASLGYTVRPYLKTDT